MILNILMNILMVLDCLFTHTSLTNEIDKNNPLKRQNNLDQSR